MTAPGGWKKLGPIFSASGDAEWMASHACIPVASKVGEDVVRIYYGPRDSQGRTSTSFIDVAADDPRRILYVHDRPVLGLGPLGAFDESGAMPSCVVAEGGRTYLYYIGWNRGGTVPFRNSIGLAVSEDGGRTFERMFPGPILDRGPDDPYFVSAPFVLRDGDIWKMWYISATEWRLIDGLGEPRYQVKYATSPDGISWERPNIVCLPYASPDEVNSRPSVLKDGDLYRMWYCFRANAGYRSDPTQSYRIGYAESDDGMSWRRLDEQAGIERSREGWDSQMIENPFVYEHAGRTYMLYNGNGFGATGFGCAVLD